MKMFAKFVPFMLVTAMSVFTACGGDSGSNADSEEPVSSSAVKKSSSSKGGSASLVLRQKNLLQAQSLLVQRRMAARPHMTRKTTP